MPRIHHIIPSFFLPFLFFIPFFLPAQTADAPKAKEGWHLPPNGRLHVLVVFAEINFDSSWADLDPIEKEGTWQWKAGELPIWKNEVISPDPSGNGWMTEYFKQASFGQYQVTGDYLNQLVTLNLSEIRNNRGQVVAQEAFANNWYKKAVVDKIASFGEPQFAHGSQLSDFDHLTFTSPGQPKIHEPNGKIDLVMLIFRNIHVANLGEASGFVQTGDFGDIGGMHSDLYSIFRTSNHLPKIIMRHEFSHMLYGGNNFHTANGGVGQRTFLSTIGGWSNMSASDACSATFNAWDRERLGWQNPQNPFLVHCACAQSGNSHPGIMAPDAAPCPDDLYVLRDFVTTGDAIKIELPHIPEGKKRQYLWLENHQSKPDAIDHDKTMLPGLYAWIQAGKDEMEGKGTFGGENNYMWPLVGKGNYDFHYHKDTLVLETWMANPFTGYHYLMRHTQDLDGDGKIRVTPDVRPKTEYILPRELFIDGELQPESYFSYKTYPIFGTVDVGFFPDRQSKIGIGTNPAAVPVYTLSQAKGPRNDDVQRVYLNGLSVEILRQTAEGELVLRIRWDDYAVEEDVRWCGNILLTEQVRLAKGREIKLAQGLSAQLPQQVQELDGQGVFALPTLLEVAPGATLEIGDNAELRVESGSGILVRKGATVILGKKSVIDVQNGAFWAIEQGAKIVYSDKKAKFNLGNAAMPGLSPLLLSQVDSLGPTMASPPRNR